MTDTDIRITLYIETNLIEQCSLSKLADLLTDGYVQFSCRSVFRRCILTIIAS